MDSKHVRPISKHAHCCYFCHPECFEPLPAGKTLCARCGVIIDMTPGDPMNESMDVCDTCSDELDNQW